MKPVVIVMGVAGCGKTEIGQRLATRLSVPFHDGDDYHPAENVAKMSAGTALNDDDRVGWLQRLSELLAEHEQQGCVVACSALKGKYRKQLSQHVHPVFVHLVITPETAAARLNSRPGHFMPASLIASQFETLEVPADAVSIDAEQSIEAVAGAAEAAITRQD